MKKISCNSIIIFSFFFVLGTFIADTGTILAQTLQTSSSTTTTTDQSFLPEGLTLESRVPVGTIPMSAKDLTQNQDFTGNVSFPISLVNLGGFDVQLKYYNKGVANNIRTENHYASSGPYGLGWELVYGSISAEINGSADTSDDRYFYNGSDGSFQLQEDSTGVFHIPNYKPWKIERIMNGNIIAGWIITKEDGTIFRFGNHHRVNNNCTFSVTNDSTFATRFFLGYGSFVANPKPSLYPNMMLIPYQWDLSDVEDLSGNHTRAIYQPVLFQLRTGELTTGLLKYTRESHPYKIIDNRGTEVVFNFAPMDTNEYYSDFPIYLQNLVDTLFLSSVEIKGNSQQIKKYIFTYQNSDILNLGVAKRYLTGLKIEGRNGASLPSYSFGYYGLSGEAAEIFPGAIKWVIDPQGGKTIYTYKTQTLPNVTLSKEAEVGVIDYWAEVAANSTIIRVPSDDGLAGNKFVCVRTQDDSLHVFQRGANGWFLDTSFPALLSVNSHISIYNDYIEYFENRKAMLARLTDEGWKTYNVTATLQEVTDTTVRDSRVIGTYSNYFVIKYNSTKLSRMPDAPDLYNWDVAIVMFTNKGLKAFRLSNDSTKFWEGARIDDCDPNNPFDRCEVRGELQAFCGQNYIIFKSYDRVYATDPLFSHFKFSNLTAGWKTLMFEGDEYLLTDVDDVPHVRIGKNFVMCAGKGNLKVYRHTGNELELLEYNGYMPNRPLSFSLGDNYYAYSSVAPNGVVIKTWDGTSFNSTLIAPEGCSNNYSLSSVGSRLVISWNAFCDKYSKMGFVNYSPSTGWSPLTMIDSVAFGPYSIDYNWNSNCVSISSTEFVVMRNHTYPTDEQHDPVQIFAYTFRGNSLVRSDIDLISLRSQPSGYTSADSSYEDCTIWSIQPGDNFIVVSRPNCWYSNMPPDRIHLYSYVRNTDGTIQFTGSPNVPVVEKITISDGMGNNVVHNYAFQNGVLNDYNTPEYNHVTNTIPGGNGGKETYYYTSKDSVVNSVNYKNLSGSAYNIKEKNSQANVVREIQKNWATEKIDPINGVYFQKLLSESLTTDGVTKTTSYDYNNKPYFSLTKKTETNSDGIQRVTENNYAYQKYNALNADSNGKNMLTQIYSTTIKKGSDDVESKNWTVWNNSDGLWRPREEWIWKGDGSSNDLTANDDPDIEALKTKTYDSYDNFGNLVQFTDANGNSTTSKWSYQHSRSKAVIKNAKNGECGFIDMENEWEDWETGGSSITNAMAHTGLKSALSNNDYGPTKNFYAADGIDKNKNYILEGWVYKISGTATLAIEIRDGANQGLFGKTTVSSNSNGWEFISIKITPQELNTLPSNGWLRVWCGFIGAGNSGYVDDLRFYPSEADMITMTFDPVSLLTTSKSDENNIPLYAEYDGLGRPVKVFKTLNGAKTLSAERQYYYSRDTYPEFSSAYPNSVTTILYDGLGNSLQKKDFSDGLGRTIQQQIKNGSNTIVASALTYDSNYRLDKTYKAYEGTLAFGQYDPNFALNSDNYYYGMTNGYPYSQTSYYADPLDRVYKQSFPGAWRMGSGHEQTMSYSSGIDAGLRLPHSQYSSLIETASDEQQIKSATHKDNFGRIVTTVQDPDNLHLETDFEYNVLDKLIKSIDPSNKQTTYAYNPLGQLTQKATPDAGTINYLFDENGNLRFIQDANQASNGRFTYNKYDALNRLIETGEYLYVSGLTQANAYSDNFPESNKIINQEFVYGAQQITGQKNLKGRISKNAAYRQGSLLCTTFYSYDDNGRIEWMLNQMPGATDKEIIYWYDLQGNITKKCVIDMVSSTTLYTFYKYDIAGRLKEVYTNTADSETNSVKEAEYTYNADGTIKRLQLSKAQGMDYLYNERGWLTQINHQNLNANDDPGHDGSSSNGIQSDKFAELIGYNLGDHIAYGTGFNWQPQYNGNISWVITNTASAELPGVNTGLLNPIIGYTYNYDGTNRLTKADFGYYHSTSGWSNSLPNAAMYDLPSITYYANGNINTLQRNGVDGLQMDNFIYYYNPANNRLDHINNYANGLQTYNYTYDNNGNAISDTYRGVVNVVYNNRNLPEQLTASGNIVVNYSYDGAGNRIRKQSEYDDEIYVLGAGGVTEAVFEANGNPKFFNITAGAENLGRYEPLLDELKLMNKILKGIYSGNRIIVGPSVNVTGIAELKAGTSVRLKPGFRAFAGCSLKVYIDSTAINLTRFYYLKDHLGSTRVTVNEKGDKVSYDDYDPWGMQLDGRSGNLASAFDKYKFTGKERDVETGYDYFGARYYDSRIARWMQVDPMAEKYPGWSPYNYVMNNPLIIVDPNGMDTLYFDTRGNYRADQIKKGDGDHVGYYTDKDGNLIEFGFNDQSDAASILSSVTDKHKPNADGFLLSGISIGQNSIGEAFVKLNVSMGKDSPVSYPYSQSKEEGLMDYVYQINKIDKSINSKVTVIDGVGYNNFDLGNYYWGKTMGQLGYPPSIAKLAAQAYERLFKGRNDHPTDQRAIGYGARKK